MTRVLVLYYSSYGHIEKMAGAVAEGVKEAGAEAIIKRVPELVPEEIAKKSHFKLDQPAPIATVAELPDYDAIILGVPTRYGNMPAQMKNFLDQTGGLWIRASSSERSEVCSRQRLPDMVAKRARSCRPTRCCCIWDT